MGLTNRKAAVKIVIKAGRRGIEDKTTLQSARARLSSLATTATRTVVHGAAPRYADLKLLGSRVTL